MNNQPLFNVPGTPGSPQKPRKSSGRTTSGRSTNGPATNGRSASGRDKDNLPDAYQKARRKRAASRQKRRFEAVIARLPKLPGFSLQLRSIPIPAVLHPTPWSLSKAISLLLVLGAVTSFVMLNLDEEWFVYREDVRFHNLIRMRGDDLYSAINLDGLNVFWVEPEAIRNTLLSLPWVEDAQVEVALPATISVNITEMTPAAVWVTNGGNYWLAMNGAALPIATLEESALPELALPQIVDSLQEARAVGTGTGGDGPLAIDPQVLNSALTLIAAMPELGGSVRYNESVGLNFALPEPAVWVYWGDGFDLEDKMETLAVVSEAIRSAEEPAQIVDVRLAHRPYVR